MTVTNRSKSQARSEPKRGAWGRFDGAGSDVSTFLLTTLLLISAPFMAFLSWSTMTYHDGSLTDCLLGFMASPISYIQEYDPRWLLGPLKGVQYAAVHPSVSSWIPTFAECGLLVASWITFQAILYAYLPGPLSHGQLTPAGFLLPYVTNGLIAYILTHVLYIGLSSFGLGLFPASVIYDAWPGIFMWANIFGFSLAGLAYAKAHLAPTHPQDCKFSGSRIYDFFMGIELNPRIGSLWDFKLFFNGRPGILAWTLVNLSFAAAQHKLFGAVSNSMILVNILQAFYVIDFFLNEDWYLRTIDIAHDHFGFYLAWGDITWLPFMYTLQAQYLVQHPVNLSPFTFWATLALGLSGYVLFRAVNAQKDQFRAALGKIKIWGKPATYIRASYKTGQGELRTSLLLTSGFWGLARHVNYAGDLALSLAMCLACGTNHILPYFYIVYMTILLLHRIWRDDMRCRGKYGEDWNRYCEKVPYKIIPYVF